MSERTVEEIAQRVYDDWSTARPSELIEIIAAALRTERERARTVCVGRYTFERLVAGEAVTLDCGVTLIHASDLREWAKAEREARVKAEAELARVCMLDEKAFAHWQKERERLTARAEKAEAERDSYRKRKDAAYEERNRVVAALARLFPSGITRTDIPGWDAEWHGCVYIDTPAGQLSWHYHDSQAPLFDGLPPYQGEWDGHDTPEKYRRLAAINGSALTAERDRLREALKDVRSIMHIQDSYGAVNRSLVLINAALKEPTT